MLRITHKISNFRHNLIRISYRVHQSSSQFHPTRYILYFMRKNNHICFFLVCIPTRRVSYVPLCIYLHIHSFYTYTSMVKEITLWMLLRSSFFCIHIHTYMETIRDVRNVRDGMIENAWILISPKHVTLYTIMF